MTSVRWPSSTEQRVCLITHDDAEAESILDLACQQHHNFAVVHGRGALISNISIAENLMLSSCWHKRQPIDPVLQQAQLLLSQWLNGDLKCQQWFLQRPSELQEEQRRLIVLLRAALLNPDLLLIAHDWFSTRSKAKDRSQHVLREHFSHCRWWWFATEAEHAAQENWLSLPREAWHINSEQALT